MILQFLILDALVCGVSFYVAYNSEIHIATLVWAFASGIWFTMALNKAMDLYYYLRYQRSDQLPPNHLPKI